MANRYQCTRESHTFFSAELLDTLEDLETNVVRYLLNKKGGGLAMLSQSIESSNIQADHTVVSASPWPPENEAPPLKLQSSPEAEGAVAPEGLYGIPRGEFVLKSKERLDCAAA